MKVINQIFPHFNNNSVSSHKSEQISERSAYKYNSSLTPLLRDVVSFGQKINQNDETKHKERIKIDLEEIKNIVDLPCVYCGKPMLTQPEKNRLVAVISRAKGEKLIEELQSSRKFLRGVKKDIAQKIIAKAYIYPDDNIQELLLRMAPESKAELEIIQSDILRRIAGKYTDYFETEEEKHVFELLMYEGMKWIRNEDETTPFKRKSFLYELNRVLSLPMFRNPKLVKRIVKEAEKLPHSKENESAFIVKYQRRSPREISEMLFYEPTATIEHIKPKSVKGPTSPENLAIACAYCNNYVRNNLPMTKFAQMHPEIEINIKKNFDRILNFSKTEHKTAVKKIQKFDIQSPAGLRYLKQLQDEAEYQKYVAALAMSFESESEGKLNLDKYVHLNEQED